MFSTVVEVESQLGEIVARRRALVAQQTILQYHALLSSLIHHGSDVVTFYPEDDEDCFSTRLDQVLRDLADIDPCADSDADVDLDAVLTMAAELSLGWLSGSTSLYVAGQRTIVPNVSDICYQKLLLYNAAMSPCVTPLSVYDVDELLQDSATQTPTGVQQPLPASWTVPDIILAETAGHVYRLLHGLERCCRLDSPSCVLTGLVVYDRLCRLHQHGGGTGVQQQAGKQRKVDENHHQTAADPDATEKVVENYQSASNKSEPAANKSRPESG